MHKRDKIARIVLGNQNWTILVEFTGISAPRTALFYHANIRVVKKATATVSENVVHIGEKNIELSTALGMDFRHIPHTS